ncbi:MAG: MFS transporter [Desulfovibrionaceae bacterium]|nr:MFS transporter [Desulfovibrionaceae bacterium]
MQNEGRAAAERVGGRMLDRLMRRTGLLSMAVWVLVLACTLFIYDTLLYFTLDRELWSSAQAEARITAQNLARKLSTGVRFGKDLGRYHGLGTIVAQSSASSALPMAVFDKNGDLLRAAGLFPPELANEHLLQVRTGDYSIYGNGSGRAVLVPVPGADGHMEGRVGAYVDGAPLAAKLRDLFAWQIVRQAAVSLAALLLLAFLMHRIRARAARSGVVAQPFPRYGRMTGYAVFLAVMLVNGCLALHTVSSYRVGQLHSDMEGTGSLLTETLNRLLMVGISFEHTDRMDAYLTSMTAMHDGALALEVVGPDGRTRVSSVPEGTRLLPWSRDFPLLNTGRHASAEGTGWLLRISCVQSVWFNRLRLAAMDMLTLVVIAMIFMIELSLLLKRGLNVLHGERVVGVPGHRRLTMDRTGLVRPLIFGMRYAMGMTLTFIPLRMAELMPAGSTSHDMLMSLPISTEMLATGAIALVAGSWVQRQGVQRAFLTGFAVLGLGYLASMLAADAGQFITARAVTGVGFGIVLLAAQLRTGSDGLLPDMYAGFYAGSVCGSAMGGMLAQQFGYMPVFLVSAVLLFILAPISLLLMRQGGPLRTTPVQPDFSFGQVRRLLGDRAFWSFILLILVPVAMLNVGLLQYLLPVYLTDSGTVPADIGRIFMLHCLLIIYGGPLIARRAARFPSKNGLVCIVGAVSGLALFAVAMLPPVPGMLSAVLLLGFAASINFAAQGRYVKSFVGMRSIGFLPALCLISVFMRAGHVLGPIAAGLLLPLMSVSHSTFLWGIVIVICSCLFLLVSSAQLAEIPAFERAERGNRERTA